MQNFLLVGCSICWNASSLLAGLVLLPVNMHLLLLLVTTRLDYCYSWLLPDLTTAVLSVIASWIASYALLPAFLAAYPYYTTSPVICVTRPQDCCLSLALPTRPRSHLPSRFLQSHPRCSLGLFYLHFAEQISYSHLHQTEQCLHDVRPSIWHGCPPPRNPFQASLKMVLFGPVVVGSTSEQSLRPPPEEALYTFW